VIESNHDVEMLRNGRYPSYLKQRISSPQGHLSNDESAELLDLLTWEGLEAVFLAHLSMENNLPEIALHSAETILLEKFPLSPRLIVTRRDAETEVYVRER